MPRAHDILRFPETRKEGDSDSSDLQAPGSATAVGHDNKRIRQNQEPQFFHVIYAPRLAFARRGPGLNSWRISRLSKMTRPAPKSPN